MISTSQKYKQEMISGNRNYVVRANMTLADGTSLVLTNEELWDQGVVLDNAISSANSFDIGSAIVGSLTLVIDNIKGNFNTYDFANAKVVLWMGIENDLDVHDDQVYYRIGFYVVDNTSYNGSLITLDCLDNMTWFDVPFNEITGLSYPTTAGQLVADICAHVGVLLGVAHFQNYTMPISEESGEWLAKNNINCREVLQYVAQKCCCYCKINTAGELILNWYNKDEINNITNYDGGTYNTTTTPYSDGCDLDGGHFVPWDGDSADGGSFTELQNGAWLTRNFEMNVSTEGIVITGCRVRSTSGQNQYDELYVDPVVEQDHDRYVLVIENNPLITASEAATVANIVGSILSNLPLRAFDARSISDMSYETGDMVTIMDFRGNIYYTWITNLTFTAGNSENFSCGAQSLKKRNETRFSEAAKTLAEANENATAQLTAYENAQAALNELAQNALDYYKYEHTVSGSGMTTWLHSGPTVDTTTYSAERPLFPDSANVIKISGDGMFLSHDHGETYPLGLDANSGAAILDMIFAHGINCDWIHAGTLTLGGQSNTNGVLRILNASGSQIGSWDNSGINASAGTFSGTLNAASGTISDGVGTLSISGGDLNITNGQGGSDTGGAGVFARKTGTYYYACWGAVNSASRKSSSQYIETPTWNVIQAGINASDRRLKKNIKDLDVNFAKRLILGIKPKSFRFKKNKKLPDGLHFGVIAQDVKQIEEECGIDTDNRLFYVENDGTYAVDYRQLIAPMIKVIQEQQKEIELLKQKVGV